MYKKVIDLLVGMSNVEKEKLAVELAKHHPSIFVKLALGEEKKEVMIDNNIVFIINAIKASRWGDALKGIREYFGHSIHESLAIINVYDGYKGIFLSHAQTATLNKLKDASKVLKFADMAN